QTAERWWLRAGGGLDTAMPTASAASSGVPREPGAGGTGTMGPGGHHWDLLPKYDWPQPQPGKAVVFESAPLAAEEVMLGPASFVRCLQSSPDDADLQVTLSEVRADGQEMYVQSGGLPASYRASSGDATALWP